MGEQIEKAEQKQAKLTDTMWMVMPSTRANYVAFAQRQPNPFFESAAWTAKGRAESGGDGVEAKVSMDLNSDGSSLAAYIDAQAAFTEGGQLKLTGNWQA